MCTLRTELTSGTIYISSSSDPRGPRLAANPKQEERRDAGATGDSRRKSV